VLVTAKRVIFEGVERAVRAGAPSHGAGILVDEAYGAQVARSAREAELCLAMPVEEADQACFAFAYGAAYGEHIDAFKPDFAKVLVRYNVEGEREVNAVQADRLAELSQWVGEHGYGFLFELIVEPTAQQLHAFDGQRNDFEQLRRPELMCAAMAELQAAGAEPDVWKLEGIDEPADAERVVSQARAGRHRGQVACVVLGAGAGAERVEQWLRVAAAVQGFVGFAIGRSIWRDAVRGYISGDLDRERAGQAIADGYSGFVRLFESSADRATAERAGSLA
jgi:myo-inositol catabolism protein IolC